MRIFTYPNAKSVATAVEEQLQKRAVLFEQLRVFLPTGRTPLDLYALFRDEKDFWKTHLEGVQIDEFVDPSRPFLRQLEKELCDPIGIKLHSWDPEFTLSEAKSYCETIMEEPIDIALLGLGMNGHVGFHEPGVAKTFIGGPLEITEETRNRAKGPTSQVLTFGVGAFLRAKEVILIVTGEEKREIFEKFQSQEPSIDLPATLLKEHKNFYVFTDLD